MAARSPFGCCRGYAGPITGTADTSGSHELTVGPNGSISADQIARLGFHAGSHLRVVVRPGDEGRPARGSLAGVLRDHAALDRFDGALVANRRERIAAIEQAWEFLPTFTFSSGTSRARNG